jgi:hypothetical protein
MRKRANAFLDKTESSVGVVYRPLHELKLDPNNPRVHSPRHGARSSARTSRLAWRLRPVSNATTAAQVYRTLSSVRRTAAERAAPSPLAGKVFDEGGECLTPIHAVNHGRRYCYYVSRNLRESDSENVRRASRLPTEEIETAGAAGRGRFWKIGASSLARSNRRGSI